MDVIRNGYGIDDFALLVEDCNEILERGHVLDVDVAGKLLNQMVHVGGNRFSQLVACLFVAVFDHVCEKGVLCLGVSCPKLISKLVIARGVMTFELNQESPDRHPHQACPCEGRHIREHVSRVETLLVNLDIQFFDQSHGHVVEDTHRKAVFANQLHIPLKRPRAEADIIPAKIQSVLHPSVEQVGLRRFVRGPGMEFLQQDKSCHGIEFFGRTPLRRVEVVTKFINRHQLENDPTKHPVIARNQSLVCRRRKGTLE